ncbi:helix-turn-helix domain-containing protein [Thauera phenolivorans]|uniref:helix-turn-helix domain-containing protein n=1 Tax=Thauera phenolivorans TaxID=1792543 RepID=UPI00083B8340|nr:helix-turn-helix domain-containing protein [Thauera phenolivorans]
MDSHIIQDAPQDGARQRACILQHLTLYGQISTTEARERYGIMSPASRVLELRRAGHQIDTVRLRAPDANGQFHNQAKYVMRGVK